MESSIGFMTVFAVSGSVVLLAAQLHKRLLSDYMDKLEPQHPNKEKKKKKKKKKVSFAEDMVEPSGNNEEYRRSFRKSKLEDERRSPQKSQLL
ncbi:hypothetical protein ISN45_Aa04g020450 [Arabidopsis thaliana x Arabidopsis arenosa]|uniref:Transmembrane protein n=1 Tax=Arabidopsis thaliana x Arabidopsis arenosa TaxID=1240361 RepID=A0A8T2ACD5_9BRAS|nr:hypothetical protein ISN45_Aa04g020450 [Arabidopsis thaliana x Arabidopsis arenosa]